MPTPRIKLIMSDIDGTILPRGEHMVSARTLRAFRAARDAGLHIGPASGRSIKQIPAFFAGDDTLCATAIATNGLEVYADGEKICEQRLPLDALDAVCGILASCPRAGLLVFDDTVPQLICGSRDDLATIMPSYAQTCVSCNRLPGTPPIKANVFIATDDAGTADLIDALNASIAPLDFDSPLTGYANIMPSGWNKGSALRVLCEHLGVGADEAVVFGDAGNDLALFGAVTHSVAVAHATPPAAAAARWHIGACEDDAVAAAIERIVAGADVSQAFAATV